MPDPQHAARCAPPPVGGYRRREPERTVLYEVVGHELGTFLARQHDRGRPVPHFVERELRGFLECGILAHGFVRVHCDACGKDRVAPRSGPPGNPRRLPWAELMRRVFAVDVLECPACGGRLRILAAIHNPDAVRAILDCLELPSRPPPTLPPKPDATADLFA